MSHVQTTPLTSIRPPVAADHPLFISSVRVPDCPFEELAALTAWEDWPFVSRDDLVGLLEDQARAIGGHGLVALRSHGKGSRASLTGTVIRFLDTECQSSPSP